MLDQTLVVAIADHGEEFWDHGGTRHGHSLYEELVRNPLVKREPVETIMQEAFPFVDISTPVDLLSTMITPHNPAVLVRDFKTDETWVITRSDVIQVLS